MSAAKSGKTLVFDIETYRPVREVFRDRRIELSPEENYITVTGVFDGDTVEFSPVTPLGQAAKEEQAVRWICERINAAEIIVGFNILRFDLPYIVHKSTKYGLSFDVSIKRIVDLFWLVPAWLDNTESGKTFAAGHDLGKVLSLNKVEKYLLNKQVNAISHDEYFRLYEAEEYGKITEKLRADLISTYELFTSPQMSHTFEWISNTKIDPERCIRTCPFRVMHSVSLEHSQAFCPLISKIVSEKARFSTLDVIGRQRFPDKDTVFSARCLR